MRQRRNDEAGVAEALDDVTTGTRNLIREEIAAARRESRDRARALAPGLALVGGGALLGVFAMGSAFRMTLRLLEKYWPPATAATVATAGFAGVAAALTAAGIRWLQGGPSPAPVDTLRRTAEAARETVRQPRG